jgi:hypothetical protein
MSFDFAMPLTLFLVTLASLFLNNKTEGRLKLTLEEKEFRVRDAVLFVGMMAVMISLVVFVRQTSLLLTALFLFSYSLLLFTFGYVFSGNRWYLGVLPPAVFVLLYVFLRNSYVWTYYLANAYGVIFAVLVTLYIATLFTWKTTAIFGVLITMMDIFLVLVTKQMVQAASAVMSLSLPVLVWVPLVPPQVVAGEGVRMMGLGLGDFFFAGLLAIQSFRQYGRRFAILSAVAMTISFFVFEAFLLSYRIGAFPGTLMIISGWVPLVLYKSLKKVPAA